MTMITKTTADYSVWRHSADIEMRHSSVTAAAAAVTCLQLNSARVGV